MKQDKSGYVLTMCIHPNELPTDVLRDFVGARYQVVMVRLNEEEKPMDREQEHSRDMVRVAGILCRDKEFWQFLKEAGQVFEASEEVSISWLKDELGVLSRSDIPNNQVATEKLKSINKEFQLWKQANA